MGRAVRGPWPGEELGGRLLYGDRPGRVSVHRLSETAGEHRGVHRQRGFVDQLTRAVGHDGRAEDPPAAQIPQQRSGTGDELDPAGSRSKTL
jgi:hypothetical protein